MTSPRPLPFSSLSTGLGARALGAVFVGARALGAVFVGAMALGPAEAQSLQARPVQSAPRDAGVLHLSTRTWTRGASAAFGADVLYANDATPGYFASMPEPMALTDEGRLPGLSSEGTADEYQIDGLRIAYCTATTNALTAHFEFFESYAPCTEPGPSSGSIRTIDATGLPTTFSAGVQSCWLLTLDLAGTSLEFVAQADGADGVFDNVSILDSFGWTLSFTGQGLDPFTGSILAGDPGAAPYGGGTVANWGFGPGPGTGLFQEDHFWVDDTTLPPGCYSFGGYPANPWAGLYMRMFGDEVPNEISTPYPCTTTANSTGSPAHFFARGSASVANSNLRLEASPAPNQPGIFFYGTTQVEIPFGNGYRCVGGAIQRLGISFAAGNRLRREVSAEMILYGAVGGTWNFQAWFRDPAGGGLNFNFSDAATLTVLP